MIKSDVSFSARRACDHSSALIITQLNWGNLLQELRDVLAAALGPGPRVGVVVEGRSHDMILALHASLPALGVVVVRHVEPGAESRERDAHKVIIGRLMAQL